LQQLRAEHRLKQIGVDASSPANREPRTPIPETTHELGIDREQSSHQPAELIVETVVSCPG